MATTIVFDNSASIFGHLEAIQFYAPGPFDNGYFDAASADSAEELAERIRSYLVRNTLHSTRAGDIRHIADALSDRIMNAGKPEDERAMLEFTLYALNETLTSDQFADVQLTAHFVTTKGEYLSIKNR